MSHQSDLISSDINAYLAQHENKELLRFLTCGSVDDGKSTLIGRLLHDSKMIYEDQLEAIKKDSVKSGTTGEEIDLALLVDGLQAEREQGITIDVAYRYFSTTKRKFIIADTPGHEQYTRNMATGASTCDLAVILVDARHGVLTQTKRHSFIVSLLGIKHVVVAINKMDIVDYSEEVYESIKAEYAKFAAKLDLPDIQFIPLSALKGDNVVDESEKMPWYNGNTLMFMLENVQISGDKNLRDFRFPVQYVNRPDLNFRGYAGTIASGIVQPGDEVMALPSRQTSTVERVVTYDGDLAEGFAGQAVTLTLNDEIDVSRGDMLVRSNNLPLTSDKVVVNIVWMDEQPMLPGKQYYFKQSSHVVSGTVKSFRHQINVNNLEHTATDSLSLNEIAVAELYLSEPISFDSYTDNSDTGSFIIIDRLSNGTVGAGMIVSAIDQAQDYWQADNSSELLSGSIGAISAQERQARFEQKPVTLLLTGLVGSGKTTLAYNLERRLFDMGKSATVLDGQNLRLGATKDLGFDQQGRSENLRRAAEIAKLMNTAGLICICSLVAPEQEVRDKAAAVVGEDNFIVVHLNAPIEVCQQRDVTGVYDAAKAQGLATVPGLGYEYQAPNNADLILNTEQMTVTQCLDALVDLLRNRGAV